MYIEPVNNMLEGVTSGYSIFDAIASTHQNYEPEEKSVNTVSPLYLQYPNETLTKLARWITKDCETNDQKMAAIRDWVVNRIPYKGDSENYGTSELWAAPMMTLLQGAGDCEDGAFLIMSLALNAGVPEDRLRIYGGEVKAGEGAATGGHGWVAYRRETDNEWVPVDFSYYPNKLPMSAQTPMRLDMNYIDDYFYMTLYEYVNTPGTNRVRQPDMYTSAANWVQTVLTGFNIDVRA